MNGPIAVLAGTPVDTRMGVAYLEERGLPGVPFPLSRGPREQTAFQHAPAADKRRQALAVLRGAMAQGCRRAFVYCNSLSAAVDFPGLAEETGMRIVTPLDVYRRLAPRYRALRRHRLRPECRSMCRTPIPLEFHYHIERIWPSSSPVSSLRQS